MSVQYEISAIDCGLCPRRVSDTYAICSGATTVNSCNFTLKTVIICGSIVGLSSSEPVYIDEIPSEPTTSVVTSTLDEGCMFSQCICIVTAVIKLYLSLYRDNFQEECYGHFELSCGVSG